MLSQSLFELLDQVEIETEVEEVTAKEMAIVGMALNFPQAGNVRQFWSNLRAGLDCVTGVPGRRKRDAEVYLQRCLRQDALDAQFDELGYLDEIDTFDYEFFGLSPKEASLMDPAHRLFLQCAWQAAEDAGYGDGRLSGTDTGVFLGYSASELYDYKRLIGELEPDSAALAAAGNIISMMASRVAYAMDLHGPSMMIDTACSSSLVALHEACKAIRAGDCSAAIVGGIRLNLVPVRRQHKLGIESADSRTRTFDDKADGSTLSEGVAAVVIKPLPQALKDGDAVYAVIKGSAINQDGRSNGITAPNPDAQAAVIEKAWKAAGVHPETISYIEMHGTGTKLGDPIEMEGLMKAFVKYTDKKQFCAIGSVKSNLGHLDSAAGLAGLIKAVLSLKHEELPASLYFNRPNRKIRLHRSPFHMNARLNRWPRGSEPRRCGVSAFGISGTNCHVVLEEAPEAPALPASRESSAPRIFAVSAKSRHSLVKLAEQYIEWLREEPAAAFDDVCHGACTGRGHYKYRLAVIADGSDLLAERLRIAADLLLDGDGDAALPGQGIYAGVVTASERDAERATAEAGLLADALPPSEAELRQIAALYTAGADVQWRKLYKGERRVRTRLPVYPFLRNRCWLEMSGNQLYRSFFSSEAQLFVPEWRQADNDQPATAPNGALVVFMDSGGIAEQYAERHNAHRSKWVEVTLGHAFAQTGERRFTVGRTLGDYERLVDRLRPLGVAGVVHFAALDDLAEGPRGSGDRLADGLFSLFLLVSALRGGGWKSPLRMTLVAPQAYGVSAEQAARQAVVRPEFAAFFGYGKVVSYELPGSTCRCIDWDGSSAAHLLFDELDKPSDDYVSALRGGRRYVERIALLDSAGQPAADAVPIRSGATYVITGGVGIVGLQLAKELAASCSVRIVLLNRSPFPAKASWERVRYEYEMDRKHETLYKRMRLMEQIEAGGSEVVCMQADIADERSLSAALADIRERFGPIRGVIHAAGIVRSYDEVQSPLTMETLCEDLSPKVAGTRLLDKLTDRDPLDFFVLCSSVMTLTGGNNVGGYVAANAFLDAFTDERNARGKRTVAVNWSTWEETFFTSVLGAGKPEYARLYGQYTLFKVMSGEHAGHYFAQALAAGLPRLIAGQFNRDADIVRMLDTLAFKFADETRDELLRERLPEAAGTRLEEIAEQGGGLPDVELKGRLDGAYSAAERGAAAVWSRVLGYRTLGVADNFYELGGDSISMMKLIAGIDRQFGAEMKPTVFMELLTIERMASWLDEQNLGDNRTAPVYPAALPDPDKLAEPFEMTEVQRAYYMGRSDYFEMGGVSTHAYSELETRLDPAKLNDSLNKAVRRHPMLRCVILPSGKQKVLDRVPDYRIETEDIRALDEARQQERIGMERRRMSHDVFRPERWPLFEIKAFRIRDDAHYLCIGFDVLIADGLSMQIIENDIMQAYLHPHIELPPLVFTFRDYMQAYEAFRRSDTYAASKTYWLGKLDSFPEPPSVPLVREPGTVAKPTFRRLGAMLGAAEWQRFKNMSARHSVTPSAVFCAIYADVLSYWSNQPRLAINLTVFNRYPFHPDIPNMVGDFTSLMLLGLDLGTGLAFWDKVKHVHRTILEAIEHRHFDGTEMIRELAKIRQKPKAAMMPFVFTSLLSQDFHAGGSGGDVPGDVKMRVSQTSQVYLDFQLTERGGVVELSWDYAAELFDEDMMSGMFETFMHRVERLAANEGAAGGIRLPQAEAELYARFNETARPLPQAVTLDGLFAQRAARQPDKIAVISGEQELTYGQLSKLARQFAVYLRSCGISRGDFVGVLGRRDSSTIALILGALMVGAAYVPVEPEYPEERRNYIVGHSGCRSLIDAAAVIGEVRELDLEPELPGQPLFAAESCPNDTAYVIYTSGSTGTPKGVVITHRAAANTILDINERFAIGENDRIPAISSFCFDLSVYDWFGALAAGAAVIVIDNQRDMPALLRTAAQAGATVWNSVPALLNAMLDHLPSDRSPLSQLRVIMLSGDWIPLPLAGSVREIFPTASLYSLGGATEAAIWSIYYPVADVSGEWKSIPYGVPLGNQRWYVLDEERRICPVGTTGELYIGGAGLASGYLHDEDKTKQSFIVHPEFGTLYRTGDFGAMRREGYIEFLGRRDHQVKIRGYRVELGEIENLLLKHPGVKDAVVIDKKDAAGQTYLAAYIVRGGALPEADRESLYEHLSAHLPGYMIPARCTFLDSIPLSANGKVDRKLLPEPELALLADKAPVEPSTELEKQIFRIWTEVLGMDRFGIKQYFFDIGGDSISLMSVHGKIENLHPNKVSIADLFAYPTVETLAGELARRINPDAYKTVSVLLPADTRRSLDVLARRCGVNAYGIYLVAFVFMIADLNGEQSVKLVATDEAGIETAHRISLADIESVEQGVEALTARYITDSVRVVSQAGPDSGALMFAREEAAVKGEFAAALCMSKAEGVQALYKASAEASEAAKALSDRFRKLLHILAEQL